MWRKAGGIGGVSLRIWSRNKTVDLLCRQEDGRWVAPLLFGHFNEDCFCCFVILGWGGGVDLFDVNKWGEVGGINLL